MKAAWLADPGNTDGTGIGGAELTQSEFRSAAPEGVRCVTVTPDTLEFVRDCDVVCCFNVALFPAETQRAITGKRVVRYWNDIAPHGDKDLTRWFLDKATNVFCSPLHFDRFPHRNGQDVDHVCIPPPVKLDRFRKAAERSRERSGAVSVSAWRGWGKTPFLSQQWAMDNGIRLDFYGSGQCAPPGSQQVLYADMPDVLAKYETFVYLPTALEPFCRMIVEANAAGCEVVTNSLVGAVHYLKNDREALGRAAEDYWKVVLDE